MRRAYAWFAAGLLAITASLIIPSAASAATQAERVDSTTTQSVDARPGCDSTGTPPPRFIRVKNGTYYDNAQKSACQQCDDNAWTWAHQGFRTYCWEIAATAAELWIGPVLTAEEKKLVELAGLKTAVKSDARPDPWLIFDRYPNQQACEGDRARGVNERLWTWERSHCATNGVEWVLLIDYGPAPMGTTSAPRQQVTA